MFVTMVEGFIEPEREDDLRSSFVEETARGIRPAGLIESSLLRSDDGVWRIVTVWESRDAVIAMREQGRPAAVVMFQDAGARPRVALCEVEGRLGAEG